MDKPEKENKKKNNSPEEKVEKITGVNKATIDVTWEPPWDKSMMSEEAKLELGFL